MTDHSHIAMSFEANNAVGPLDCSAGGVPYNSGHIEYWKGQAREARAEITKLRAERDAATVALRPFALVGIHVLKNRPGWANAEFSGDWAGAYRLTYAQFEMAAAAALIATEGTDGGV